MNPQDLLVCALLAIERKKYCSVTDPLEPYYGDCRREPTQINLEGTYFTHWSMRTKGDDQLIVLLDYHFHFTKARPDDVLIACCGRRGGPGLLTAPVGHPRLDKETKKLDFPIQEIPDELRQRWDFWFRRPVSGSRTKGVRNLEG